MQQKQIGQAGQYGAGTQGNHYGVVQYTQQNGQGNHGQQNQEMSWQELYASLGLSISSGEGGTSSSSGVGAMQQSGGSPGAAAS